MYANYHAHSPMMFWIGRGAQQGQDWRAGWWDTLIEPVEKVLTPSDISALAEVAALAYNKASISEVWDMYYHEDRVAQQLTKHGITVYAGETIAEPSPNGFEGRDDLNETERLLKKYKSDKNIIPVVAPIGIYPWHMNYELFEESIELACKHKARIHVHGAGSIEDDKASRKTYGMPTLEVLEKFGTFSEDIPLTVIAHCTVLSDKEIEIMSRYRSKVLIAVCPSATEKLNYPPVRIADLLKNHISVALGTDGASPAGLPDIEKEMEVAKRIYGMPREYFQHNIIPSSGKKIKISHGKQKEIIERALGVFRNGLGKRAGFSEKLLEEFNGNAEEELTKLLSA